MHFPPPLHVDIGHPDQHVPISIIPLVRFSAGMSDHLRRNPSEFVGVADTAWRAAVGMAGIRGLLGAVLAVEAVVALAVRAVAFGRKVGEAEEGVLAQEIVDGLEGRNAGADY